MKFLALALSSLLGMASLASAKRISTNEINKRIQNGQFNKKTILSKARPYGRRMEENDAEEEAFEISGDYTIQFNTCLSLKMESEDLFDENIIDLAANDVVIAEKSLILFNVCETQYCAYEEGDAANTYVVDIATFIQALAEYLPAQRNDYCEACEENYEYCENYLGWADAEEEEGADEENGDNEGEQNDEGEGEEGEGDNEGEGEEGEEGDNEGEGEEGENNDGEGEGEEGEGEGEGEDRKLAQKTVEYINCEKCVSYQCIEQDNGEDNGDEEEEQEKEMDYDNALEWIQQVSQCAQFENEDGNGDFENLYGGFICNEGGSGVELAVFLDEDCSLYHKQLPFGQFVGDDDASSYYKSATIIEHMFTTDLDCAFEEIEYVNPNDYDGQDEEAEGDDEEEEDNNEASEYCRNLFEGDFEAVSIANCEAEEEDENQEEEQENDYADYEWYSFELSQEDAEDSNAVCRIVESLEGEYYTVYDTSSSGQFYDFSANSKSSQSSGGKLSGGAIFGIILLIAVAAVGAAWAFSKKKSKSDKKKPLISGSMA